MNTLATKFMLRGLVSKSIGAKGIVSTMMDFELGKIHPSVYCPYSKLSKSAPPPTKIYF